MNILHRILRASTFIDYHFRQVSFNNVAIWSKVYEGHRGEFDRRTTWLHACWVVQLAVLLHNMGVVVKKGVRRSVGTPAVSLAVVGIVTTRSYDPVFPTKLLEADKEPLLTALPFQCP